MPTSSAHGGFWWLFYFFEFHELEPELSDLLGACLKVAAKHQFFVADAVGGDVACKSLASTYRWK
jgi:hypothetical protein